MSECVTQDYATTWVPDPSNEGGPKMHFMNTKSDEAYHITYHLSLQILGHMKADILSAQWKKSKEVLNCDFDLILCGRVMMCKNGWVDPGGAQCVEYVVTNWNISPVLLRMSMWHIQSQFYASLTYWRLWKGKEFPLTKYPQTNVKCEKFSRLSCKLHVKFKLFT